MTLNRQYYDHTSKSYIDLIRDNRVIVNNFDKLVHDSIVCGSYSELAHIYALSASIGKPIRSYFQPQMYSEYLSEPFTRKVVGRKLKQDYESVATVMWTQMHAPRTLRDFNPKTVRVKSKENHSPSQTPRRRGSRQNQTSANRTNVRKALRLALSSPSEVIAILKGLRKKNNTRTK